jgi:endonuclease G
MSQVNDRPRLRDMRRLVDERPSTSTAAFNHQRAKASSLEALADRQGFDENFLSDIVVPLPAPVGDLVEDVTPVAGSEEGSLDYTHFSIVMSRSRRLAIFTALNLDGRELVDVPRENGDWRFDPRLAEDRQVGESLYARNPLDRGHLVRRTSANWGDEAAQANADTFHFTNCTPQMAAFNQRTWLGLEDYLLEHARADRQRLSVFTGPIFRANDRRYRGIQIPEAYWKVVAFMGEDGRPSATAYMIEQSDELDELETGFMFGQYKTYQRSVMRIEALAQLDFGELSNFDGFSNEERDTGTRIETEIRGPSDIRV